MRKFAPPTLIVTNLKLTRLDRGRTWPVLLLKFRLIRLQHSNLPPSIEEQSNCRCPKEQDQNNNQRFLCSDHNFTCLWDTCNKIDHTMKQMQMNTFFKCISFTTKILLDVIIVCNRKIAITSINIAIVVSAIQSCQK